MPRDETRAALRKIWGGMRKRCYDRTSKDYHNYGAKGIRICDEWKDDFQAFYDWAMAHGYRKGLSIDRICNSRGYSPGNCRWVTKRSQALNRSTNTRLEACGKIMTMSEWSELNGIRTDTIVRRLEAGWSVEDAVTRPVQVQHHHKRKKDGLRRSREG